MNYFSRPFRLLHIFFILVRYNLDEFLYTLERYAPFRFLGYSNPWYWLGRNKHRPRAERLRLAIEKLGPIFIKAGQIASTRRDMLPDDIAHELAKLQDQVPPFAGTLAIKIIEHGLKKPWQTVFQQFDSLALASASIAQVHAATLMDGRAVVVKVLRPHVKKHIDQDMSIFKTLARLTERYIPQAKRFKPLELVAEIEQTLYDELDLLREGANGTQLRRNFLNSSQLYVPEIYWEYSCPSVLVMERIVGLPIHAITALRAAHINLNKLAKRCIEVFFTQVFRDSFFHADMHPGNIFVSPAHPHNPQLILVDFGIVGSLNARDQRYLAENLLAFFNRDYQRVAELHLASGWLPADTRIDLFAGAIRAVCEPIFSMPLKKISFGMFLLRLFKTAKHFNINIQPQLILLQKTLLNVEGVCRQIDPDLDIWSVASPYLEKWLKQQMGAKAFLRRIRENLPYWSEKLPEMPNLIYWALVDRTHKTDHQPPPTITLDKHHLLLKMTACRSFLVGISVSLLIGGLIFWLQPIHTTFDVTLLAAAGGAALLMAIILLF